MQKGVSARANGIAEVRDEIVLHVSIATFISSSLKPRIANFRVMDPLFNAQRIPRSMPRDMRQAQQRRATTYQKAEGAGKWRTAIAVLAISITCSAALSGEATAQDNKWADYFEGACPNETNMPLADNMEIIATGAEKVLLPHRGVFSVSVPKSPTKFAAENTMAAFQHAQCLGFRGVEIDLKYTADNVVVLSHETVLGRVNTVDDSGGNFHPEYHGEVNINGTRIVNAVSSENMTRIQDLTWTEITRQYFADKTYDADGRYIRKVNIENPASLTLKYILQQAPYASNHFDKLVLVLDIQNYHTFDLVRQVVAETNAWDRVVFKLWSEALPVYTLPSPSDGDLALDFNDMRYAKGYYVLAFNQFNTRPCAYAGGLPDCSLTMEQLDAFPVEWIEMYSRVWHTATQSEVYHSSEEILAGFHALRGEHSELRIIGAEVLAPDTSGRLRQALLSLHDSIPYWDGFIRLWGVVRKYDYQAWRCSTQPEEQYGDAGQPVTSCPDRIPNSLPATGHLTGAALEQFKARRQGYFISTTNKDGNNKENIQYNGLSEAIVKIRQKFGRSHRIQVYDIRERSDARQFGAGYDRGHFQHRAAMMSTLTPLVE